ncbi:MULTISPECIES: helix-turn-helix transcriptional regulator [unclassified Streptomyces]|jgi:transcriptional regulator with XRE-family HTH domain|uniref:helix-turn-helix domain-containing protein n=1 Tax=unclassified Streptomyces TaxID=2593676 RepID=UPI000FFE8BCA|nr:MULTISPECIES: helix-turn-helix transcriptional regulator [unclassified Streptomyces]
MGTGVGTRIDTVTAAADLGAVIRAARAAVRMTQVQLGRQCGYSASAVSRIESNKLVPPRDTLLRLAAALGVEPVALGLVPHPGELRAGHDASRAAPAGRVAVRVLGNADPDRQEDEPVRRRQLLAGAVGLGAAMATGQGRAVASNRASDPAGLLEAALFQPQPAKPMSPARLQHALSAARRDFRAARYAVLGEDLGRLIAVGEATREVTTGAARVQTQSVVARSYVLASELAVKVNSDVAWATADRALNAARESGQPAPLGEAVRVLAIAMRRSGRAGSAVHLLARTAAELGGENSVQAHAVRASLLLTGAYSAAQAGDRATALDLAGEAEETAARLGADPRVELYTVEATPAQVALYRIGIHNVLGTPDEGVAYARSISPTVFPTAERQARYWTDVARMWAQIGDHHRTYTALRAVDQAAPEEARRPSVQALTADLLYTSARLPKLREFAARTGAA